MTRRSHFELLPVVILTDEKKNTPKNARAICKFIQMKKNSLYTVFIDSEKNLLWTLLGLRSGERERAGALQYP